MECGKSISLIAKLMFIPIFFLQFSKAKSNLKKEFLSYVIMKTKAISDLPFF